MKRLAIAVLVIILCLSSSFCVMAGEGGEMPDTEQEKLENGGYFDNIGNDDPVKLPQAEDLTPQEQPTEPEKAPVNKSLLFWLGATFITDFEFCLLSALVIPILSAKLNLDELYTLKSGSYWIVRVKHFKRPK